jgi:predicted transglutaminase-like cysteine proteinase
MAFWNKILILILLTGCVANIQPPKINHAHNQALWDEVKKKQPLPPKKTESSLEALKIAYQDCLLPYATDIETWGGDEYFATPDEYFSKGKGDCEDFAICVFYKAKDMGAEASLVIGSNGDVNINHVVTEVFINNTAYIADNNIGYIVKASQYYDKVFRKGIALR